MWLLCLLGSRECLERWHMSSCHAYGGAHIARVGVCTRGASASKLVLTMHTECKKSGQHTKHAGDCFLVLRAPACSLGLIAARAAQVATPRMWR